MTECKNPECKEFYPHYGLAPHIHDWTKIGKELGNTVIDSKPTWPDNFKEDPDQKGCGTWYCPDCNKR